MPTDLSKKITSQGYWRVNFRPVVDQLKLPTVSACEEIVERCAIQLRGWEYPAIVRGADNVVRDRHENFFEFANDWWNHIEFWRMYQSGQFLHYVALREDWIKDDQWATQPELKVVPGTVLGLIGTIYEATEIFTFLANLVRTGIYDEGVEVDISLNGLAGRVLWLDDPRRVRFSYKRKTAAERLEWKRVYSKSDIIERSTAIARDMLIAWFDRFGWKPPEDQVRSDQEKLLNRQL